MKLLLPSLLLPTLLLICCNSVTGKRSAAILFPETKTLWGEWGSWEICPSDTFVSRFHLKVEGKQGRGDDTALNAVRMICSRDGGWGSHELRSAVGAFGNWRHLSQCSKFYTGIQFRSERPQGDGDNTAGNNIRLLCDGKWHDGGGLDWGEWTAAQICPTRSAICGLRTKVQAPLGSRGDDTALNAVHVQCCYR